MRASEKVARESTRKMVGKVGKIEIATLECSISCLQDDYRKMGFCLKKYNGYIYFSRDKFNMLDFDWKKI